MLRHGESRWSCTTFCLQLMMMVLLSQIYGPVAIGIDSAVGHRMTGLGEGETRRRDRLGAGRRRRQ